MANQEPVFEFDDDLIRQITPVSDFHDGIQVVEAEVPDGAEYVPRPLVADFAGRVVMVPFNQVPKPN